jgi:GT2 family glycosyltransferase
MAVRNPHGHNMCFRRQALEAVGGFDTAMGRVGNGGYAGEEAEVCLRLRRAFPEGKVLYQPGAAVVHKVPRARATFRYLLRRAYAEGLCKGRLARLAGWSSLESERHYLRHVLLKALPARLFRPWSATSLAQAVALLACVAAVAAGYLVGRLGADRPGRSPGVRR